MLYMYITSINNYMITFINWILALLGQPGIGWNKACNKIESLMVTPLFVYKDSKQVAKQSEAMKKSKKYNAVCGLVDLQEGRDYIFMGRNSTKLDSQCKKNIRTVLGNGLTPILIIRNDWAVRNKWGKKIPSIGGPAPANQADFYNAQRVESEYSFLSSLKNLFPYIHIQVNIEPEHKASADFAFKLASKLRDLGFKNKIIVNPYSSAVSAHQSIRPALDSKGVLWARSWHNSTIPPDPIWNSDGNTKINRNTAVSYYNNMKNSGREFIMWSQELANCPSGIPGEYL